MPPISSLAVITTQFESVTRPVRVGCSVCAHLDPWPECLPADTMRQLRIGHGLVCMGGEVANTYEGFVGGSIIDAPTNLIVAVRSVGTSDLLSQYSTLARRAWAEASRTRPQGLARFIDRITLAGVGWADADDVRWVTLLFLVAWEGWGLLQAKRWTYAGPEGDGTIWREDTGRSVGFASTLDTDAFHASALILRSVADAGNDPQSKPGSARTEVVLWLGAEHSERNIRLARTRAAYLEAGGSVPDALAALKAEGHPIARSTFYDHLSALDEANPDWRASVLVSGTSGNPENSAITRTRRNTRVKLR